MVAAGSGRAPIGGSDEKLAVDIGRQSLDAGQFATEFFETEIELEAAARGAASWRGTSGTVSTPAQSSRFRPRSPPPSRALTI
jgi:hypothetical protein